MICQLMPAITARVRTSCTRLDTTPERVSEKARWAPMTSLLRRLTRAPVRVRMKNATGIVCTWSNTARRRSRIKPSPMRADHNRVNTAATASTTPIAAISTASPTTTRTGEASTIAVTTRPASTGVRTASDAPKTERMRKTTIRRVWGRANCPIRRKFSRVKTLRSSEMPLFSARYSVRMAAMCMDKPGHSSHAGRGVYRRHLRTTRPVPDLFRPGSEIAGPRRRHHRGLLDKDRRYV